jgi:16S rRNA G1207 methylase RsmC
MAMPGRPWVEFSQSFILQCSLGGTVHYYDEEPVFGKLRVRRISVNLRGFLLNLALAPGVFSSNQVDPGSELLAEVMIIMRGWRVLDLGCGYGVLGIVAAKLGGIVTMVDVNRFAVRLARLNARLNGVNAEVRVGDLFKGLGGGFNTIVTNPPISAGLRIVEEIIEESPRYLVNNGLFQVVVPRKMRRRFLEMMRRSYSRIEELGRSSLHVAYVGFNDK